MQAPQHYALRQALWPWPSLKSQLFGQYFRMLLHHMHRLWARGLTDNSIQFWAAQCLFWSLFLAGIADTAIEWAFFQFFGWEHNPHQVTRKLCCLIARTEFHAVNQLLIYHNIAANVHLQEQKANISTMTSIVTYNNIPWYAIRKWRGFTNNKKLRPA